MSKTFVIGDIHGAHKALLQCLDRSNFDKDKDTLIFLGDVADGWSQVPQCVEELLSIPNLINIKGNHDDWAMQWLMFGIANEFWLQQGGQATYDAYQNFHFEKKDRHLKEFFGRQHKFYVDEENRVFVHGGYRSLDGVGNDEPASYMWDRELWSIALSGAATLRSELTEGKLPKRLRPHKEIFIGHTTTVLWGTDKPMNACNVWNLDTGAGFGGRLTIMDVNSKEYWQSDKSKDLYPDEVGRGKFKKKKQ